MNRYLFIGLLVFIGIYWIISPSPVNAQIQDWDTTVGGCVKTITSTKTNSDGTTTSVNTEIPSLECIPAVFQNVVTAAIMFAGIVAVFFVIYSGIRYITSRGDPKAVEAARNTLTWAIIGLVVILMSFAIIAFISYFTNTTCITSFGFDNCATTP